MKLTLQPQPIQVEILIRRGLLHEEAIEVIRRLGKRVAVITHDNGVATHAKSLCQALQADLFTFSSGEEYKTRETKAKLEDQLLKAGFGRDTVIVAVGGGVVTDVAGFVAATYCRGVPLVLVPTSLLAMVDACLGGKTGVNMPKSKNFIGAIYQPHAILIDPEVLETQPLESYRDGLSEMIKHGMIWDAAILDWIEDHWEKLLQKDPGTLEKAISDSCQVKLTVVERDEKEEGLRRILNFGHTVGHGIESSLNYSISHGTAVAVGCLVEGYLSKIPEADLQRVLQLYQKLEIPLKLFLESSEEAILDLMKNDKKAVGGKARFVTLARLGSVEEHDGNYCRTFDKKELQHALRWCREAVYSIERIEHP